jgi:hypothetical protein
LLLILVTASEKKGYFEYSTMERHMDKSGVSLLIVSFFQEGSEKASFAASRAGLSPCPP